MHWHYEGTSLQSCCNGKPLLPKHQIWLKQVLPAHPYCSRPQLPKLQTSFCVQVLARNRAEIQPKNLHDTLRVRCIHCCALSLSPARCSTTHTSPPILHPHPQRPLIPFTRPLRPQIIWNRHSCCCCHCCSIDGRAAAVCSAFAA